MQTLVHLGGKPITLSMKDFSDEVDVDQLTSIDYSNLYGESVTVPALLNQVGILKAGAEKVYAEKKLEADVYESELRQSMRKSAVSTGEKITENGLNEKIDSDQGVIRKKKEVINAKYNLDIVDSLFWSVSAKNKKLDNLVKGVTPQELYNELQDGIINNILIKKHRSIVDK
jgi:hypothetical protein